MQGKHGTQGKQAREHGRRDDDTAADDMTAANDMTTADLVVLSHLRWVWVWQRPQHLISRLGAGRRTWFVEEPAEADVETPAFVTLEDGPVTRVALEVPRGWQENDFRRYEREYAIMLRALIGDRACDVWLYTPTALDIATALQPRLLTYDVMDDLASFRNAPEDMVLRQRRALAAANVLFTGGRSLYHSTVKAAGAERTHLFPSGVEIEHYASARTLREPRERPVAGYVGVIDERLDLDLIADVARALPDWDITMVGPIAKIDEADLPCEPNIRYLGIRPYDELPSLMAGFDVALMPFALNEATRSISPTKTLEYLAAGLPVVSTRVPDVVADWSSVVHLADDADEFAAACRKVAQDPLAERDSRLEPLQRRHEWDVIATGMSEILQSALRSTAAQRSALDLRDGGRHRGVSPDQEQPA